MLLDAFHGRINRKTFIIGNMVGLAAQQLLGLPYKYLSEWTDRIAAGELPRTPHEPTRGMLLPSALLVLACLLVGMLPGVTVGPFE